MLMVIAGVLWFAVQVWIVSELKEVRKAIERQTKLQASAMVIEAPATSPVTGEAVLDPAE